jgi:hypothetical protein
MGYVRDTGLGYQLGIPNARPIARQAAGPGAYVGQPDGMSGEIPRRRAGRSIHNVVRCPPAVRAGVTVRLWGVADFVRGIVNRAARQAKAATYRFAYALARASAHCLIPRRHPQQTAGRIDRAFTPRRVTPRLRLFAKLIRGAIPEEGALHADAMLHPESGRLELDQALHKGGSR